MKRFAVTIFAVVIGMMFFMQDGFCCSVGQCCGQGKFLVIAGNPSSGCASCYPGSYCPGDDTMKTCPGGTYSNAGATQCIKCQAGTFANYQGGYIGAVGGGGCEDCPAGTYSNAGAAECTACEGRTYSSNTRATQCSTCPTGQTPNESHTGCVELRCPAGQFNNGTSCEKCRTGTYSTAGATQCTPCSAGTMATDSSGCMVIKEDWDYTKTCGNTTYAHTGGVDSGATQCIKCQAGTYSESGANYCIACPGGKFSEEGATQCSSCPKGTEGLGGKCYDCGFGTYADKEGTSLCTQCPDGQTTKKEGATSADMCVASAPGKFIVDGKESEDYCYDEGKKFYGEPFVAVSEGTEQDLKNNPNAYKLGERSAESFNVIDEYKNGVKELYDYLYSGKIFVSRVWGATTCAPCPQGALASKSGYCGVKCASTEYLDEKGFCKQKTIKLELKLNNDSDEGLQLPSIIKINNLFMK